MIVAALRSRVFLDAVREAFLREVALHAHPLYSIASFQWLLEEEMSCRTNKLLREEHKHSKRSFAQFRVLLLNREPEFRQQQSS